MSQTPRRTPLPDDPRLLELLADRAAFGLSDAETVELRELLAKAGVPEDDSFDLAAAEAHLAMLQSANKEAMPAHIAARIEAAARSFMAEASGPGEIASSTFVAGRVGPQGASTPDGRMIRPSVATTIFPWLIAAACMALAVVAWKPWTRGTIQSTPTLAQERAEMLAQPGTIRMQWADFELQGEKPEIQGVNGDVVWSKDRQTGFMRFTNLPKNDPGKEQYQVWIVDERGLGVRISGAVFSACPDTGECIVKMTPGIQVGDAALFAVTIEKPGGVWVSDMKRRVVVAAKGT